jgi:hypothetical protein
MMSTDLIVQIVLRHKYTYHPALIWTHLIDYIQTSGRHELSSKPWSFDNYWTKSRHFPDSFPPLCSFQPPQRLLEVHFFLSNLSLSFRIIAVPIYKHTKPVKILLYCRSSDTISKAECALLIVTACVEFS